VTITVSTDDRRSVKALAILADAGQWLKIRAADGRKYYGVRSQANPETIYFVDCVGCSCPDFLRRLERESPSPCKRMLAVGLHCARVNGRKAQLAESRRRALRPQPRECGVCNVTHPCEHCPRMQSCTCERRPVRVSLVGRLAV
jgi:predicted nucleic acid-binding Zn finger protein